LILLVLGGIYAGIFTPTEAAAVGAVVTAIMGLIRKSLSWKGIVDSFKITMHTIGMVFLLLFGAVTFSSFMTAIEIPMRAAEFIAQLPLSPYIILVIVLIALIIIGLFLDVMAVVIIVMPILHPVLVNLGFDPLLVGVTIMMTIIMGSISPPFGMLVFVLSGVVRDVPITTIFRGALPFFGAMGVALILITIFPQIALWLPSTMK
jgi:C4-dicarboxylate transporter DctM subunit